MASSSTVAVTLKSLSTLIYCNIAPSRYLPPTRSCVCQSGVGVVGLFFSQLPYICKASNLPTLATRAPNNCVGTLQVVMVGRWRNLPMEGQPLLLTHHLTRFTAFEGHVGASMLQKRQGCDFHATEQRANPRDGSDRRGIPDQGPKQEAS